MRVRMTIIKEQVRLNALAVERRVLNQSERESGKRSFVHLKETRNAQQIIHTGRSAFARTHCKAFDQQQTQR